MEPRSAPTAASKGKGTAGSSDSADADPTTNDLKLKAAWYSAELLGNVIGATSGKDTRSADGATAGPSTREELVASLREDYAQNYFVSGKGAMLGYAPDCEFADPFVSFKGVDRFKANVSNLGGLMRDIRLDISKFEEQGNEVFTKWRFSCVLSFPPWRPRLAAAGSTRHVIDPSTNRVVRHIENWEVEPQKVLRQLMVPDSKVPVTKWENFAVILNNGDLKGLFLFSSPFILKLSMGLAAVSMTGRLLNGGVPPTGNDLLDLALFHVAGVCTVTEVNKLVGQFTRSEM